MTLGFIMGLYFVCAICRVILFKKRDINPILALIPGVNKYQLGKSIGCKKLGVWNAILLSLVTIFFLGNFGLELWIIQNYAYMIQNPVNGIDDSTIEVLVPDDIAAIAVWSNYILIISAFVAIVVWCIMMWKFTMAHHRNPWWIMLWAIIPTIPYIVFAASPEVVINGKRYTTQRIELEEPTSNPQREKKRRRTKKK